MIVRPASVESFSSFVLLVCCALAVAPVDCRRNEAGGVRRVASSTVWVSLLAVAPLCSGAIGFIEFSTINLSQPLVLFMFGLGLYLAGSMVYHLMYDPRLDALSIDPANWIRSCDGKAEGIRLWPRLVVLLAKDPGPDALVNFIEGENMRTNPSATEFALVALIVLCATTMLFAVTIRGSSGNGEDSGAPNWLLLGRSKNLPLNGNGKTATMRREIVCPNQDVENAQPAPVLTLSGSCDSGATMLVYQFQSTARGEPGGDLQVLSRLPDGTNANNFGVV